LAATGGGGDIRYISQKHVNQENLDGQKEATDGWSPKPDVCPGQ
jgi:hypothetical protein